MTKPAATGRWENQTGRSTTLTEYKVRGRKVKMFDEWGETEISVGIMK